MRGRASRRALPPAHRPAPSCPGAPAQLTAGGRAPTQPWLLQESEEEPGVNRLFSLNGIDYFCNQHLFAETEHPLLQDCKAKISQGRGKRYDSEAVLLPCALGQCHLEAANQPKAPKAPKSTHSPGFPQHPDAAWSPRVGDGDRGGDAAPRPGDAEPPAPLGAAP